MAFITGAGVKEGGISSSYASIRDIVPTIIERTGLAKPSYTKGDKPIFVPTGKSLSPLLLNPRAVIHAPIIDNGEMFGRRYARKDNWKAVFIPEPTGPSRWELFDLSTDAGETRDLAVKHPDILAGLRLQWLEYAYDTGVIVPIHPGN